METRGSARKLARRVGGASGLLLALTLILSPAVPALAVPQLPHRFDGAVTINGSAAPAGVSVSGTISGVSRTFSVTTSGAGNYSELLVNADDPDTSGKEGGVSGDTVQFSVAGISAGTAAFSSGSFTIKNLSVTTTPPSVTSSNATGVTTSNATLNGNLNSRGTASSVSVFFQYGTTAAYGTNTTAVAVTAPGSFSTNLTGLTPNTTYHFRAVADGGVHGDATPGADASFTTSATTTAPSGVTVVASGIGANSATLNGNLMSMGTAGNVTLSFQYGTTTAYGSTASAGSKTSTGAFSATVTGLLPSTLYHFRVVADGGIHGSYNGEDMTFTTSAAPVTGGGGGGGGGGVVTGGGGGGGGGSTISGNLFGSTSSMSISSTGVVQTAATATSSDGKTKLSIAAGTVAKDKNGSPLTSLTAAPVTPPAPPANANVIGLAYGFGPDGATFSPAISLSFTYTLPLPSGVTEDNLTIAWWDGSKWVELAGTVDKTTKTVTAQVAHFTTFALIGKAPAAPVTTPVVTPVTPITVTPTKPVEPTTPQAPAVTEPAKPTEPEKPAVTEPAKPVTPPEQAPVQEPESKTNWGLIGGIIGAVIVVAALAYFARQRRRAS